MLGTKWCIPEGKSKAEGVIEPWGDSAEEPEGEPTGAVEGVVGPLPAIKIYVMRTKLILISYY